MKRFRFCRSLLPPVLVILGSLWAALPAAGEPPLVTIGVLPGDVVVDGRASDGEWLGSTPLVGFNRPGGEPAAAVFTCRIGRDGRGLAVLWRCQGRPIFQQRGHDGSVWLDDSVELMLQAPGAQDYCHFIVNAAGDRTEAFGRDTSWNADWDAAAVVEDGSWVVEMRVPFAALGASPPEGGAVWRGNANRSSYGGIREVSSWAPVEQSFHEANRFGHLRFAAGPCPAAVESVHMAAGHRVTAEAVLEAGARLSAALLQGERELSAQTADRTGPITLVLGEPGTFLLRLTGADAAGATVFRQELTVVRKPPLAVSFTWRLLTGREATVRIDCAGLDEPAERLSLKLAGHEAALITLPAGGTSGSAHLDLLDVPAGETELLVEAWSGNRRIAELREPLTLPERPAWLGSTVGASDEVPEPWTPVLTDERTVRCWGRSYDFGDGALPERITTAGEQILSDPMRLTASVNGREQRWGACRLSWTSLSKVRATCTLTSTTADAHLRLTATTEFDGLMRLDVAVTPRGGAAIGEVRLELPVKLAHARYLHACDASWGRSVAGALPEEGWTHDFMPFVWLGDEDRGLQWFCESDEGWRPADPKTVLTIERAGEAAVLRVNMVGRALEPGSAFRTSFGVQATPAKPIPPDWREWHITHGAYYGMQHTQVAGDMGVSYPAEGNVRLDRGSVDVWVKPLFDPQVGDRVGDKSVPNHSLFGVELANGDHWGFYWNRDDRDMRYYGRVQGEVKGFVSRRRSNVWRQDEWHHLALTWGDALHMYMDGALVASHTWQGTIPGDLEGARIWLGTGGIFRDSCGFVIDALRISDEPLDFTDPALRDPNPRPDEHALLLDGFGDQTTGTLQLLPTAERIQVDEDWHGLRIPPGARLTEGVSGAALQLAAVQTDLLSHLKSMGVNYVVFHEHWTEHQAYGSTAVHDQELRELVAACHAADIKLLLYFGYQISDAAPEFALYGSEVMVQPRSGGYRRKDFPQTAYICCFQSPWKEYYLTSIARMIDEYDIDGVYLDGTTEPFGCANELHGCGYLGEDGRRHKTYPIFAVRDLMQRMMQVIKSRKPEGLISAHMSASVTMPTLAFVDDYWDGEQLDVKERGFRLPLDAFRAEFMGRNWGLPAEFLSYEKMPFTFEEALGLALLHDVPVRPSTSGGKLPVMSRVWSAWEEFGVTWARWVPYWQPGGPLSADAPEVLISAHVGGQGVLAVVMNSGQEPVEFGLNLDAAAARLARGRRVARDVISGAPVEFTGEIAHMKLEPLHMVMLGIVNE